MADTRAASGLTVQQWDEEFFVEYIDDVDFADIMGESPNAIIQLKENLTKKKGDSVTFALLNRLKNAETVGNDVLEGKEEDMTSRSHKITIAKRRHGVRVSESDEQFSAIGLRDSMKPQLKTWAQENTRDKVIGALGSIDGVAYATSTAGQRNTWLTNNADRVLFGAVKANTVAGDHASSLLNVDAVNDVLTRKAVSLMKRMATLAAPKLRPVRDPGNRKRYYVMYCHPYHHRDLRTDMEGVLDDATAGGGTESMRLFEGGDLYWDGVIVKELLDMPTYVGVGAAAIDVAPAYLLGAQAIGYAIARRWKTITKEFDYGDKYGTAIDGLDGFAKLRFGTDDLTDTGTTKDNGVCTGYFAAVAD
jgi:N4-gp56 family major capsid protein